MKKWQQKELTRQFVSALEPGEVAQVMASFRLRYRESWKSYLESLRFCILRVLDKDLMDGSDVVGNDEQGINELLDKIEQEMTDDPAVGLKKGLCTRAKEFLSKLTDTK